jgi:hypothetical protein
MYCYARGGGGSQTTIDVNFLVFLLLSALSTLLTRFFGEALFSPNYTASLYMHIFASLNLQYR